MTTYLSEDQDERSQRSRDAACKAHNRALRYRAVAATVAAIAVIAIIAAMFADRLWA